MNILQIIGIVLFIVSIILMFKYNLNIGNIGLLFLGLILYYYG